MKGLGRQDGGFLFFFFFFFSKRTPGKVGRPTAEVEPEAAKQEGECFHVFMLVFSFTTGLSLKANLTVTVFTWGV